MIGKLRGIIDAIETDHIIVDVNGVGYVVFCSSRTLRSLPFVGEVISLVIETHVREDHIHLYGFLNKEDRDMFRILLKVNGVGAKMALSIQGVMNAGQMGAAIAVQDKKAFQQVSGVGPKLAARLITELKDVFGIIHIETASSAVNPTVEAIKSDISMIADAVSALVNLGYNRDKAYEAVTRVIQRDKELSISDIIRESLRELSS